MGQPLPKQFCELAGIPVLIHTIMAFAKVEAIREIIVVAPAEHVAKTEELLENYNLQQKCRVVVGGILRQDSVRIGLSHVSEGIDLVAVHDGARPLVAPEQITACLKAAHEHGAAIVAVPVKDTIKAVTGELTIANTIDRSTLWQAQTPQIVRTALFKEAYAKADQDGFIGTDEASLLEHGNWPVQIVAGSETNIKITRPDDLLIAEALLMDQKSSHPQMRIGHGYDAHQLTKDRKLILGGVDIPHEKGLLGHSDADVLTHALCDAILGAMGAGDIGRHFPDNDSKYKGISSIKLLEHVARLAADQGLMVSNADITVVAQRPKLLSYFPEMVNNIAAACQVESSRINLKGTTTEKMGFAGREEGISAHAVVLLGAK